MNDLEYRVEPDGEGHYTVSAIRSVWLAEFADKDDALAFAKAKSGENGAAIESAPATPKPVTPETQTALVPAPAIPSAAGVPAVIAKAMEKVDRAKPATARKVEPATFRLDDPEREPKDDDSGTDKDPSKVISGSELKRALELREGGKKLTDIAAEMGKSFTHLRARVARHAKEQSEFPKDLICRKCGCSFRAESASEKRCDACEMASLS